MVRSFVIVASGLVLALGTGACSSGAVPPPPTDVVAGESIPPSAGFLQVTPEDGGTLYTVYLGIGCDAGFRPPYIVFTVPGPGTFSIAAFCSYEDTDEPQSCPFVGAMAILAPIEGGTPVPSLEDAARGTITVTLDGQTMSGSIDAGFETYYSGRFTVSVCGTPHSR